MSVQFRVTTNNVPLRQAASELRVLLPEYKANLKYGKESCRGVSFSAPAHIVDQLTLCTLAEKVYAVVCHIPAEDLPDDPTQCLSRLEDIAASAPGWQTALSAHRTVHGNLAAITFAVKAKRRGKRFRDAANDFTLAARLGSALHQKFGWKVDLTSPSLEVSCSLNDEGLLLSVPLLRRQDSVDGRPHPGLDPHVAWAMVRSLGDLPPGAVVLDPMCGKASLLFEALYAHPTCIAAGLDADSEQLRKASTNLAVVPRAIAQRMTLVHGDAMNLPAGPASCDAVLCDLPFESNCPRFGHRLDTSRGATLKRCIQEICRVLRARGRAVFLINEARAPDLREALSQGALRLICERPCPLGFTRALIVVTEHAEPQDTGTDDASTVRSGPLPWEGKGKRADWAALRHAGRSPMVPWYDGPEVALVATPSPAAAQAKGVRDLSMAAPYPWLVVPKLFPKVSGDAYIQAFPAVAELYFDGPPLPPVPPASRRARPVGKLFHVTVHSFPHDGVAGWTRISTVVALTAVWASFTPPAGQLKCLAIALIYSCTEYAFTLLLERGRGYTSAAQFYANVLYAPILLDRFAQFVAWLVMPGPPLIAATVYTSLFPLNIWIFEILLGHALVWFYGHNVAYCYDDYRDAFASGCCRLGHGVFWLGLGLVCWLLDGTLSDLAQKLLS